jgi:uncharacterized protein YjbI with pentapeptide repeats
MSQSDVQVENVWTHFVKWFKEWGDIAVGMATVVPLLLTGGVYIWEKPTRDRAATLASWNLIASMETKRASGGREEALRQLKAKRESLAGIVLNGAILKNIDMGDMDVSQSSLKNIDCVNCSFYKANLYGAELQDGQYRQGCNFSGALLEYVQVQGARFADCNFDGARLHRAQGDVRTSFNGASMVAITISNGDLSKAIFDNANLSNSLISTATFNRASFQRVDSSGWQWATVVAREAEFKIHGRGSVFHRGTVLAFAKFDGSSLQNATFENVDLQGASFFKAAIKDSVFRNCDLSGADFTSADLSGTQFENCRIEGAKFRNATIDVHRAFRFSQEIPLLETP